ncbi:hypothetical protein GIB67_029373 [Kingdonia uniflora]|uniref:AB hydrolase-1 domain-containing protein n=1 Tax=Kingdonia uniflora TaxID=39325 RepID=A0A7J7P985_9MAGN|nr:hypothetical protein GIB67_029373 [Kingdonia uniflora]
MATPSPLSRPLLRSLYPRSCVSGLWPEKVGKVVLVSSAINRKSRDQDDLLELTKMENMEDLILPKTPHALRLLMAVTMKRQLPIPVFILNNFFHSLCSKNMDEQRELLRNIQEERASIPPLKQDVLLIWGQNDEIVRLEKAFELKEILGLEKAVRLEVIKNAGHMVHFDASNRFSKIVRNFLRSY